MTERTFTTDIDGIRIVLCEPGGDLLARKDDIWNVLSATDKDFFPPLTQRTPTTLGALAPSRVAFAEPIEHVEFQMGLHVLFALHEEKAVGFLSFQPDFTHDVVADLKSALLVDTVTVLPSWRRRGLASQLYAALFAWERIRDHEDIVLHTWSTNTTHEELIRSLGFEEIHRIDNERAPGVDTVIFRRKVDLDSTS